MPSDATAVMHHHSVEFVLLLVLGDVELLGVLDYVGEFYHSAVLEGEPLQVDLYSEALTRKMLGKVEIFSDLLANSYLHSGLSHLSSMSYFLLRF